MGALHTGESVRRHQILFYLFCFSIMFIDLPYRFNGYIYVSKYLTDVLEI
jgi:hypothetical protein